MLHDVYFSMVAASLEYNVSQELCTRFTLQWRHNGRDGVSDHQSHDCIFNILFRHWSKKTSKLRVTGLCEGNWPVTGEFPAQRASNAENISIWWRHPDARFYLVVCYWIWCDFNHYLRGYSTDKIAVRRVKRMEGKRITATTMNFYVIAI